MRPLAEQTILITGVTSGLGLALAQALASKGATVLLHGRDGKRGLAVLDAIKQQTGNDKLKFYQANLASLRSALARKAPKEKRVRMVTNSVLP